MNWEVELEGVRINASAGQPWMCSQKQAGACAGLLNSLFLRIVNDEFETDGYALDKKSAEDCQWVRETLRIPFLNYLFVEGRTKPIVSSNDLIAGEASALLDFIVDSEAVAWKALVGWLNWKGVV